MKQLLDNVAHDLKTPVALTGMYAAGMRDGLDDGTFLETIVEQNHSCLLYTSGSLKIKDKETRDMNIFELSKLVGTVLQDADGQFIGLTVGEDIAFALENDCVDLVPMRENVQRVADLVDMGQLLKSSPFELSGGQKQRVSFAGVLVDDVDILLFDEPLANLDPATGKTAIDLIDHCLLYTSRCV